MRHAEGRFADLRFSSEDPRSGAMMCCLKCNTMTNHRSAGARREADRPESLKIGKEFDILVAKGLRIFSGLAA